MDKKREKQLIFELIKPDGANSVSVQEMLSEAIDYPWLLGQLLFNRMGGVAYKGYPRNGSLSGTYTHRRFCKCAY